MSYTEIIDNIDRTYLSALLIKLKKMVLQKEFISSVTEIITEDEIKILAEYSSVLADSYKNEDKLSALDIAITLPQITSSKGVYVSSFITLRKLGNYPAVKLLEKKSEIKEYKNLLNGISIFEEFIFESMNEEIFVNKKYLLSNFQKRTVEMMNNNSGISLSAPTSAGKSFILLKHILNLIHQNLSGTTIVYIVPTRALIKQVMDDVIENINELNLNNIYVGCSSEIENIVSNSKKSNVLVLTQERLYQLCINPDVKKINISMIIVDEAHNIQNGGRGVLLEIAIKRAKTLFPSTKILFSSPLVSNPEKLLSTFNIRNGGKEKDIFPLVVQNLVLVKRTNKNIVINAFYQDQEIEIGKIHYEGKGNSSEVILANVSMNLWNGKNSIIYCNGPLSSSNVARLMCESGNFPLLNDKRLDDFADFIEEYISIDYELADFIRRGIAFHFGALPSIIRSGIEELFKDGAIKIVSCTSTLLEGLNMPAKNIFIYKPERGKHKPIDSLNFWNLAGRAGRMGNDFSGNIVCINIEKWKENPLLEEKQYLIKPSSEVRLKEETSNFKDYIADREKPFGADDYNEQLVSMVIKDRLSGKRMINSLYVSSENISDLNEIDDITTSIINDFKPPQSLLETIPSIMPDRINDLWVYFESNINEIEEFYPVLPTKSNRSYNRFKEIIRIVNIYLVKDEKTINGENEAYIDKLTLNGHKWMNGESLSKILFYNHKTFSYREKELTKYVRDAVDFLNKKIRYELVKYMQIYIEVLKEFLKVNNKEEDSKKILNIPSYLEYGACTTSALEFMALGLSREAAIKLEQEFLKENQNNSDLHLTWFENLEVDNLEISSYLKKQISKIQKII